MKCHQRLQRDDEVGWFIRNMYLKPELLSSSSPSDPAGSSFYTSCSSSHHSTLQWEHLLHRPSRCSDTTMTTTMYNNNFGFYLRWGLYFVCPPPVVLSSPAVLTSWHQAATSAHSATHRDVCSTTLAQSAIEEWLCAVCTVCVCVCVITSRCCLAPCSSHSCLCLMTCRHSSLYTPEEGDKGQDVKKTAY